jgi:predicted O-methyltransferase YrrM
VSDKRQAPATARNREPILGVLARVLPDAGLVLELASGTGEHAVFFARALPGVRWQPTDRDPTALASIAAYRAEAGLANLLLPLALDAADEAWPVVQADAIVSINMIHISPFASCCGLFRGARRLLAAGAPLVLYGPFRFDGVFLAPSNAAFDADLRARDPAWGVRDLSEVDDVALAAGFERAELVALPANNHAVVFRRSSRG